MEKKTLLKTTRNAICIALLSQFPTLATANIISGWEGSTDTGLGVLVMERNDDGSSEEIIFNDQGGLNFENGLNFFGTTYDSLYVNNNGNITFDSPMSNFTPIIFDPTDPNYDESNLSGLPDVIAPFWADVDTRCSDCGEVFIGSPNEDTLVITWNEVASYSTNTETTNTFQLVIIDRDDTGGEGDFDVEFRYDNIEWTYGDASVIGYEEEIIDAGLSITIDTESGLTQLVDNNTGETAFLLENYVDEIFGIPTTLVLDPETEEVLYSLSVDPATEEFLVFDDSGSVVYAIGLDPITGEYIAYHYESGLPVEGEINGVEITPEVFLALLNGEEGTIPSTVVVEGGETGYDAQVGFYSGESNNFFVVPGSNSPEIADIDTAPSNTDTPGVWTFAFRNGEEPGQTEDNPIMPIVDPETPTDYNFEFVVQEPEVPIFIDPDVAIGYDYIVNSGPDIASVILPDGFGDDIFDLFLWDESLGDWSDTDIDLLANQEFNFDNSPALGPVSQFRIMGIEEELLVDPNDPTAFVTGLTFASQGVVDINQNAVITFYDLPDGGDSDPSDVPEPPMGLLYLGLMAVLYRLKSSKQIIKF